MRVLFVVSCCLLLLGLGACTDDPRNEPEYSDIWPHDDGLTWLFDYGVEAYPGFSFHTVESIEDLPHLPPMSVLAAYLDTAIPEAGDLDYAYYELMFDGLMTTQSGVQGQRLVEAIYELGFTYPTSPAPRRETQPQSAFLERLAVARPDLKPAIAKTYPQINKAPSAGTVLPPILMAGGAWEQNSSWIGNYGDVDTDVAWIYLTPDLDPGAFFTLQLVPGLADDVFLDVLVLDWIDFETPLGTHRDCVEVLYRIDYGVSENLLEGTFFTAMGYGVIVYAPGIGPVYSLERDLCNLLDPYDCAREIESLIVANVQR